MVRKLSMGRGKAYFTTTGWRSSTAMVGILVTLKKYSFPPMPKGAPEEQDWVMTVDIPNSWSWSTVWVHPNSNPGSLETRTFHFLVFSFLKGGGDLLEGGFLLSLKMHHGEPSEALQGRGNSYSQKKQPKKSFFRMTHAIFFLSFRDSDSDFTQTSLPVFSFLCLDL